MRALRRRAWFWAAALAGLLALMVVVPASAAEVVSGKDVYRLAAGQVIEDDLIVSASEIYIDGTVQGDLIATGGLVEINGRVEGDLMAAGAEVRILGVVTDDARVAGAEVEVKGTIGDDLFGFAGGGPYQPYFSAGPRPVQAGLRILDGAQIGGNAYIGAGEGQVGGTISGNLSAGGELISLNGVVNGDAQVESARIQVSPESHVDGELRYTASAETKIPSDAAGNVVFTPAPQPPPVNPAIAVMNKIGRTLAILIGFALLGWLLLRYAPIVVRRPSEAIAARPVQAGIYGLAAAALLIFVPLLSALLVLAMVLFWGWLPGIALLGFLFTGLSLIWVLSPIVTGMWLGRLVVRATGRQLSDILTLLVGVALLVVLALVPYLGWLIYLVSFILALGGVLLARRSAVDAAAPRMTTAPTPA